MCLLHPYFIQSVIWMLMPPSMNNLQTRIWTGRFDFHLYARSRWSAWRLCLFWTKCVERSEQTSLLTVETPGRLVWVFCVWIHVFRRARPSTTEELWGFFHSWMGLWIFVLSPSLSTFLFTQTSTVWGSDNLKKKKKKRPLCQIWKRSAVIDCDCLAEFFL